MDTLVLNKEKIEKMLIDFPENVVIEEFIDKMILTAKIEMAIEQIDRGEYLTSEELDAEIDKWD